MRRQDFASQPFDRPIIILGAPRSGTTFLGDVLTVHRDVAYAAEPAPIWRYGNESRSDCIGPEHLTESIRVHLRAYFQSLLAENHKTRLIEKHPSNSLRPEFVDAAMPEARYIHIIRHGYESSLSIRSHWETNTRGFRGVRTLQRLRELSLGQMPRYGWQFVLRAVGAITGRRLVHWGPKLPGISGMVKELSSLEVAALQWRWCVERACNFGRRLPADRYIEFKLEELDQASFQKILSFCEMDDDPAVAKKFGADFMQQATKHRTKKASEEELRCLRRCLEPTIRWLDYEL